MTFRMLSRVTDQRPLATSYQRFALVSHPAHVESLGEEDKSTLIVSCHWLLAEELAAQGRACVFIDDEFRRNGEIPGPSGDLFLRGADWLYANGDDPTVFRGVSLGRRFIRDVTIARAEIGFYEHVLPPLVQRFKPEIMDYMDCRMSSGPLNADARFKAIAIIAERLGVRLRDRRMAQPEDGRGLPHHNILPVHHAASRPVLTRAKNILFNKVVDGIGRLRRRVAKGRPAVLLLTTAMNGKPLLEAFEGNRIGTYYLADWFPGKSRVGFLLRCLARGVMLVSLGAGRFGAEDRRAVEAIRENILALSAAFDGPFADVLRGYIADTILATGRLELAAEHVVRAEALLDQTQPALVFTDGLQNAFTNAILVAARQRGIPTAATWHAPYVVDHCMEAFGSDPRTPPLVDYCLTWGRGHEEWLDANCARSAKIRTGNIVAARCRQLPRTQGQGRRALVLQYLPIFGDMATWYTPSAEFRFFIDVVRMLGEIGFEEIRFKLHPRNVKFDYYKRVAEAAGIKCKILDDDAFPEHVAWADIVISIPSSGATLEVLQANKPIYPVLLQPHTVEKRYLYGLRTYDSVASLREAILVGEPSSHDQFLEAFTSAREFPDPARRTWEALESIIKQEGSGRERRHGPGLIPSQD